LHGSTSALTIITTTAVRRRRAGAKRGARLGAHRSSLGSSPSSVFLVHSPSQDAEIRGLNPCLLKLSQLELISLFIHVPLAAVEVVRNNSQKGGPRASHNVLGIVITTEEDDLTPLTARTGRNIDSQVVATPIANQRNPRGVSVCLLHSIRRYTVLARKKILSPLTGVVTSRSALLGRGGLVAAAESLRRGGGLGDGSLE
jgi:hypothetical protein